MKTSLLILSTESLAEVLHDEHAIHEAALPERASVAHLAIPLWRSKVGKPVHSAECDRWRAIAEKLTEHLMSWISTASQPPSSAPVAAGVSQPSTDAQASAPHLTFNAMAAYVAKHWPTMQATPPKDLTAEDLAEACLKIARVQDELLKTAAIFGREQKEPVHAILDDVRESLRGAFRREISEETTSLKVQLKQLAAERDALGSQANALEQEKDAALKRLQASEERERQLTERLATIASLAVQH